MPINLELLKLYKRNSLNEYKFTSGCMIHSSIIDRSLYRWQHYYCTDEYNKIEKNKKVMVIGQQANGWDYQPDINKSMEDTKDFLYDKYSKYSSPFWQFSAKIESKINGSHYLFNKYEYFYSNIFRLSTVNDYEYLINNPKLSSYYLDNIQTLTEEIKILNPDILIFLTGYKYDQYIKRIFPKINFILPRMPPTISRSIDEIAMLIDNNLPKKTKAFRIYHPGFLNRQRALRNDSINIIDYNK